MTDYLAQLRLQPEDALQYGVQGMKWGQHRTPITAGQTKAHAKATSDMDKVGVKALNNSSKYKGKDLSKNPKLRKEYENDAAALFDHFYSGRLGDQQRNANTKRVAVVSLALAAARVGLYAAAFHADTADDVIHLKLTLDDNMQIVDFEEVSEPILAHYGIMGMKWGRRRSEAQLAKETAERKAAGEPVTSTQKAAAVTAASHPSGTEPSAARYARLKGEAKGGGAKSWSEEDLKFFNARTDALAKVNKLFQEDPSWIRGVSDKVIKNAAQKTMQDLANGITNKYITTKVLDALNDNSAAIKAESKTPVDYVAKHRAKSKK